MRNATIVLAVLAVVALGAPAYGSWIGGQGVAPDDPNDWNTIANWSEGYVPTGAGGSATISNGGKAVISASVGTVGQVYLGSNPNTSGHIEMGTGGIFGANNNHPWLTIGYWTDADDPISTFKMSGGTFTGVRTNVGNSGTGYGGRGEFEISGGTLAQAAGSITTHSGSTFRVIGSGATKVDMVGQSGSDITFTVNSGGTLNMQLDNGTSSEGNPGITRIKVHNTYITQYPTLEGIATFESGSVLDMGWAAGATPTEGTYLLLVADVINDNGLALKTGQDVADGGDWSIVWGTGSETLSVTYVPEPATLALLGLGGLGVLIRRKRR